MTAILPRGFSSGFSEGGGFCGLKSSMNEGNLQEVASPV